MTTYFFKEFLSFFKASILGEISLTNRHLHILDGHGSHVTVETIEQAKKFGLDMIILPLHTSHAFHPLNIVVCFKLFKIIFKRERNTTMFSKNYIELNKITSVGWVDKAFHQAFTRKNIMSRLKNTRIWPINPRAMEEKINPSILYTLMNQIREKMMMTTIQMKRTVNNNGQNMQLQNNSSTQARQQKLQPMLYLRINILGVM